MRFRAGLELAKGFGVNAGMAHVQFQEEVVPQGVGAFHHNVQCLDAVNGDVALGENAGRGVVEIEPDKNAEFVGQGENLRYMAATLQPGTAVTLRPAAALQQPHSM